jgi:hypothetical protein
MLTLPSEVISLLNGGRYALGHMLRVDLPDGAEGLWTGAHNVTSDEVNYVKTAGSMAIDAIDASSDLDANELRVTLSGVLSSVRQVLDGFDWHQRAATVFLAFLDEAGNVMHAMPTFSGFLDKLSIADASDNVATIEALIESNNRELSRSYGRTRSDADQRSVSADDGFFKYTTAANTDVQIAWGRKGPQYPVRPK